MGKIHAYSLILTLLAWDTAGLIEASGRPHTSVALHGIGGSVLTKKAPFITQIWHVEHPSSPFKGLLTGRSEPLSVESNTFAKESRNGLEESGAGVSALVSSTWRSQYYVQMQVGTPPVPYWALIDTASGLSYVKQQSAHEGGMYPDPSSAGGTVALWPCGPTCDVLPYSSGCVVRQSVEFCTFIVIYADNTAAEGSYVKDMIYVGGQQVANVSVPVALGVTTRQPADSPAALGLGWGAHGLAEHIGDSLFFCLPPALSSGGFLGFGVAGNPPPIDMPANMTLLDVFRVGRFYRFYVPLVGLSVDGVRLPLPESVFAVNRTSLRGGTVLDNGSVFSYIIQPAYDQLLAAYRAAAAAAQLTPAHSATCDAAFDIPPPDTLASRHVPTVGLHFTRNITVTLNTDNVLYQVSPTKFCFSFKPSEAVGATLIGAAQLRHHLVNIDFVAQKVGFSLNYC